jgi:hypothetical protein
MDMMKIIKMVDEAEAKQKQTKIIEVPNNLTKKFHFLFYYIN